MTRWVPLEANPTVLTEFANTLGMPSTVRFTDVWSVDLIDMVPAPRHAVLLLFPLTPKLRENVDAIPAGTSEEDKPPVFIKQTIDNACGTIALLHSLLQPEMLIQHPPVKGSALEKLALEMKGKTPEERAQALESSAALDDAQKQFAQKGQTAPPAADESIDLHFVAFVHKEGSLYQLDGRRNTPIKHGSTTGESLLKDACDVVKDQFMAKDPSELRFTIIALVEGAADF